MTEVIMNQLKREMARLKKEGQRKNQPDLLHHQAKSVVAFLVFLGAPWEAIKTIMLAKVSKWPVCKLRSNDISEELIKKWATDAVKKEPGICDLVRNPEHPQTIRATRWLMEWHTAHWVNTQNMKRHPSAERSPARPLQITLGYGATPEGHRKSPRQARQ